MKRCPRLLSCLSLAVGLAALLTFLPGLLSAPSSPLPKAPTTARQPVVHKAEGAAPVKPADESLPKRGAALPIVPRTGQWRHDAAWDVAPDIMEWLGYNGFLKTQKSPCWPSRDPFNLESPEEERAQLRCLPYVHILGVNQAGATDVTERLGRHPEAAPPRNAQPHFWDEPHKIKDYLALFGHATMNRYDVSKLVTYDGSYNTFAWAAGFGFRGNRTIKSPTLPQFFAASVPQTRIVVMMRNPADRLHSAFWHYGQFPKKYGASPEGFLAYVTEQTAAFGMCRDDGHSDHSCATAFEAKGAAYEAVFYHCDQLIHGMYSLFLPDWLAHFPARQVLLLRHEDYVRDPKSVLSTLFKFLAMAEPAEVEWTAILGPPPRSSNIKGVVMLPEARTLLDAFYAPFNAHLLATTTAHGTPIAWS